MMCWGVATPRHEFLHSALLSSFFRLNDLPSIHVCFPPTSFKTKQRRSTRQIAFSKDTKLSKHRLLNRTCEAQTVTRTRRQNTESSRDASSFLLGRQELHAATLYGAACRAGRRGAQFRGSCFAFRAQT